jgi:hypothetical protein
MEIRCNIIEAYPVIMMLQSVFRRSKIIIKLYKKRGCTATTCHVHVGGGEYLPMITSLASAGYPVIYCQSRYPKNGGALIMEKMAINLENCIR